jgi:hypothetical protein
MLFETCGLSCPHWIYRLGELDEPGCMRFKTVCSAAMERCDLVKHKPHEREAAPETIKPETIGEEKPITLKPVSTAEKKEKERFRKSAKPVNKRPIQAEAWPGSFRGWGPITKELDDGTED